MTLLHEQNLTGDSCIAGRVTSAQHTAGQDISGSQGHSILSEPTVQSGISGLVPLLATSLVSALTAHISPEPFQRLSPLTLPDQAAKTNKASEQKDL